LWLLRAHAVRARNGTVEPNCHRNTSKLACVQGGTAQGKVVAQHF